ncbi:helix-turn-helix domain-containing protein [Salinispora arenicola]|uniref:AlbA family DNA-binding domain-containing protein n=1 Tax=Salinispora arenicola TaxID=168697 RepID=UPI0018AD5BDE|nr:ATP-binding protein [Salinispora arenicola]
MTDLYDAGRWRTWEEFEKHVVSGELRESHTLELKRDDYSSGESGKKEQAKDIAALALDGGVLVIGVEEDKTTGVAIKASPVALAGVIERIDQICASRISPPLRVAMRDDLRSPSAPSTGVLIIEVPATGVPHMVDHRYLGRDNRTTRPLDHTEVVRLLAHRDLDTEQVNKELDATSALMDEAGMSASRLIITATPIPMLRRDALRDQLAASGTASWFNDRMTAAAARASAARADSEAMARLFKPWTWMDRSNGWGVRRIPGGAALRFGSDGNTPFVIEVLESGGARFVADFVTQVYKDRYSGTETKVLYLDYAMSFTCEALAWIAEVAEQAGLRGTYGIGLHVGDLAGSVRAPTNSIEETRLHVPDKTKYRDDSYRQILLATGADLRGPLQPLLDQLFGQLLRAMDYGDPLRQR